MAPVAGISWRSHDGLNLFARDHRASGEPERLQSNFFRGIKRLPVRLVTDRG